MVDFSFGNYKGMVDILTGKPSGFGRFTALTKIIEGQFNQGEMHGQVRKIRLSKNEAGADIAIVQVIDYVNGKKNGKFT